MNPAALLKRMSATVPPLRRSLRGPGPLRGPPIRTSAPWADQRRRPIAGAPPPRSAMSPSSRPNPPADRSATHAPRGFDLLYTRAILENSPSAWSASPSKPWCPRREVRLSHAQRRGPGTARPSGGLTLAPPAVPGNPASRTLSATRTNSGNETHATPASAARRLHFTTTDRGQGWPRADRRSGRGATDRRRGNVRRVLMAPARTPTTEGSRD